MMAFYSNMLSHTIATWICSKGTDACAVVKPLLSIRMSLGIHAKSCFLLGGSVISGDMDDIHMTTRPSTPSTEITNSYGFSYSTTDMQITLNSSSLSLPQTLVFLLGSQQVSHKSHRGWQLINWNIIPAKPSCCPFQVQHLHVRILWQISDLTFCHHMQPWGNYRQSPVLFLSRG